MSAKRKEVETFEDIADSEWPMLKKLDTAKFSLKDKTPAKKVEKVETVKLIENPPVNKIDENLIANEMIQTATPEASSKTEIKKEQVVAKKTVSVTSNVEKMSAATFMRLAVIGLSKLYLAKTNLMLMPIKFIVENFAQVFAGATQFMVPALLTYFITTKIGFIATQIQAEVAVVQAVYMAVFYFASMFLWISCQVVFSGTVNSIKNFLTNVVKAEQNSKL